MLNIILLEDNAADEAMFQFLLSDMKKDFSLKVFRNGDDIITYISHIANLPAHKPSGIVLDINVPKRNGFEVLKYIRTIPGLLKVPVVVFSSSENREDKAKAEKSNAYFFSKSMEMDTTRNIIGQIVHLCE